MSVHIGVILDPKKEEEEKKEKHFALHCILHHQDQICVKSHIRGKYNTNALADVYLHTPQYGLKI